MSTGSALAPIPRTGLACRYATNGLNQFTSAGGVTLGYDGRGNLTGSGGSTYRYDALNPLSGTNGPVSLFEYGSLDELQGYNTTSGSYPRFLSDGGNIIGEYLWSSTAITLQRRYVPGPGVDETLALIDANGVSHAMNDQRNTPSAWADAAGSPNVQLYGAFGEEGPANTGRIGYTGHVCGADRTTPLARRYDPRVRLPELGLAYYKARFYDPAIGRFLTPDPAGFTDSPNLYAYVLNDPVNLTDPSGLYLQRIGNGIFDCRRGAGGAIGDDEPRYGPVTCSYLYSIAYEADTSSNPGSGFRGSGGRGQAPPAMGREEMREALCNQINEAANRTRPNLPANPNANSLEGLRYERAVAQLDLQVIGPIADISGFVFGPGAGFVSAIPVSFATTVRFARGAFGGGLAAGYVNYLAKRDENRIAAINARILQLNAQAAGVCR